MRLYVLFDLIDIKQALGVRFDVVLLKLTMNRSVVWLVVAASFIRFIVRNRQARVPFLWDERNRKRTREGCIIDLDFW